MLSMLKTIRGTNKNQTLIGGWEGKRTNEQGETSKVKNEGARFKEKGYKGNFEFLILNFELKDKREQRAMSNEGWGLREG